MNLNKLKIFCETVKAGSIDRIANNLGMHRTNIGKSIKDLENELETKLLKRGYGDLHLTEAGKNLYDLSKNMFYEFDKIETTVKLGKEKITTFKLASSPAISGNWLPFFLQSLVFAKEKYDIILSTYLDALELKIEEYDVIISPYISNRKDLIQKEIFNFEFYIYGKKSYLQKIGFPKSDKDLKQYNFVKYSTDGSMAFHRINENIEDSNFYNLFDKVIVVNNPASEINLVKSGAALGIVCNLWDNKVDESLIRVFPERYTFSEKVYFTYKASSKNQTFIDNLYHGMLESISN